MEGINTIEDLKAIVPSEYRNQVNDKLLEAVKGYEDATGILQDYSEDMFINFIPALRKVDISRLTTYVDAVRFVILRERYNNLTEAWKHCFPKRYKKLVDKGIEHHASSHGNMFNKTPLVKAISADIAVAMHIQYAGARHRAMQKIIRMSEGECSPSLMPTKEYNPDTKKKEIVYDDAGKMVMEVVHQVVTPKVQLEALSKILDMTAIPIDNNVNINIGITDEAVDTQKAITKALQNKAIEQREAMLNGMDITDVQVIGNDLKDGMTDD
jgi:hypothetical protein